MASTAISRFSRLWPLLALLSFFLVALAARSWNVRDVFVDGHIYFLDADCYSRMSRARLVNEGGTPFVPRHAFENWPSGTQPHTTALLDWIIVGLKRALDFGFRVSASERSSVLGAQTLDFAGAIVSPLLGALTCAWLGWWARSACARPAFDSSRAAWCAPPLLFAASPILVHGTLLGRPDHQSLLLLLLAVALCAEVSLLLSRGSDRLEGRWALAAGTAWALALWVSLYEPLILLIATLSSWALFDRRRFTDARLRRSWRVFGAIVLAAFICEGWRISWPDPTQRASFMRWKETIAELRHLDPRGPLLYRWLGAGILLAPLALLVPIWRKRNSSEAGGDIAHSSAQTIVPLFFFGLLLFTFSLTLWQLRWGYFLALAFVISLPWQFAAARKWWIAWPIFLLTLWPVAQEWDEKLFPEDHPALVSEAKRGLLRLEAVRLRDVAMHMRSSDPHPFLAPWWLSPALAYWSGQPGVAGSSHESLPGILGSARFFLAPSAAEAEQIARELRVKWIVTDDPERLITTSQTLLGQTVPTTPYAAHLHEKGEPHERVTEEDLKSASPETRAKLLELAPREEAEELGSAAFSCVFRNQFYKLFSVQDATLPP